MKLKTALIKSALVLVGISSWGCSERNSLQQLPTPELRERAQACRSNPPAAPGLAIACENIAKECTRRAEQGLASCR